MKKRITTLFSVLSILSVLLVVGGSFADGLEEFTEKNKFKLKGYAPNTMAKDNINSGQSIQVVKDALLDLSYVGKVRDVHDCYAYKYNVYYGDCLVGTLYIGTFRNPLKVNEAVLAVRYTEGEAIDKVDSSNREVFVNPTIVDCGSYLVAIPYVVYSTGTAEWGFQYNGKQLKTDLFIFNLK